MTSSGAEYAGGDVERGHLVGIREADTLDFGYVQLQRDGTTSSGHCLPTVTELPDGRVRLDERRAWESSRAAGPAWWRSSRADVPSGG